MNLKNRFTINIPSQQICFDNLKEIDHSETLEKLAEHFASWEETLKQHISVNRDYWLRKSKRVSN